MSTSLQSAYQRVIYERRFAAVAVGAFAAAQALFLAAAFAYCEYLDVDVFYADPVKWVVVLIVVAVWYPLEKQLDKRRQRVLTELSLAASTPNADVTDLDRPTWWPRSLAWLAALPFATRWVRPRLTLVKDAVVLSTRFDRRTVPGTLIREVEPFADGIVIRMVDGRCLGLPNRRPPALFGLARVDASLLEAAVNVRVAALDHNHAVAARVSAMM